MPLESPSEGPGGLQGLPPHLLPRARVGGEPADLALESALVVHDDSSPGRGKEVGLHAEVRVMGAQENGLPEPRRLEDVVTAVGDETSADERDVRGAVEALELPERVDDEDGSSGIGERTGLRP